MKKTLFIVFILFSLSVTIHAQQSEKWFISTMANKPVGFLKEHVTTENNMVITDLNSKLIINRKSSRIELLINSKITENTKGEFTSATNLTKMLNQDMILEAIRSGDSIQIIRSTGGKSYSSKIVANENLLGPTGLKKLSENTLKIAGDSINFLQFSAELGIIIHGTRKLLSKETALIKNSHETVYKIKESFKENPYTKEIWLDRDFNLVKMMESSPLGTIETVISTEEFAITAGEKTVLPAETYGNTIIVSNVRFTDPRNIDQVKLKISLKNESVKFPNMASAYQHVIEQGKDYVILETIRPVLPLSTDNNQLPELSEYLEPNSLINSDNPEIMKISNELIKDKKTNFEKAIAIKNWISTNIKGDLGVALSPGSEVIQTKRGTCIAFSTLFASMLRAAKVPAKFMGGYVYMNGIWGGHAWVEVYVNKAWIPMDATINTTDIADAARISFGDGWSLNNGIAAFAASDGSVLYGNSDIKVLSYVINGKNFSVSPDAETYSTAGDYYYNPGKRFRIKKSALYEFKNLDEVWPSGSFATISFKDADVKVMDLYWISTLTKEDVVKKETETLSQSKIRKIIPFQNSFMYIMQDKTKAFFVVTRGKDLMLFYANGRSAVDKLKIVLANTIFE